MSSPRDLNLERLGDRDNRNNSYLGKVAVVGSHLAGASRTSAYQALIDGVFTAPGAREWLSALRRRVTAMLADKH